MSHNHPNLLRAAIALTSVGLALAPMTASAAPAPTTSSTPPAAFGPSWDDPRTAAPAVVTPDVEHCSVTLMQHGFNNWDVIKAPYAPPAECSGDWSKVVLRMDGAVKGRQYDRLGWLDVNGVRLLTTSTPEPSVEGIRWHVEKDVTDVQAALRTPGETAMYIGNTVNETYTGVIDVTVTLDFYRTSKTVKKTTAADVVLPLQGLTSENGVTKGTVTVPRTTERVLAQVYATGSGGGCEEFWDLSTPASTGNWCADGLPYREVDVHIDGQLAGIAEPLPYVYTGGWSNPFLWYTIPSPGAFDIRPLSYDLTPFAGVLNDGKAHEVSISVVGGPSDGNGWTIAPNLQLWTGKKPTAGALTSVKVSDPVIDSVVEGDMITGGRVDLTANRTFRATGWLQTQTGRIVTTVERTVGNTSRHSWTPNDDVDTLDAAWTDHEVVTTVEKNHKPDVRDTLRSWTKKGSLSALPHPGFEGAQDITTSLRITDDSTISTTTRGRKATPVVTTDLFDGTATWMYGVPRDQRVATATSSEVYTSTGDPVLGCYRHELASTNGRFTVDDTSHTC